jgi:hypothetical protein
MRVMKFGLLGLMVSLILLGCSKTKLEDEKKAETNTSEQTEQRSYPNEPDGFRGIKWGTSLDSLAGMRYFTDIGGQKCYTRKGDILKLGQAELRNISYCFWQGKFCSVIVSCDGVVNYSALKEAVFKQFGVGSQPIKVEVFVWDGLITGMVLKYDHKYDMGAFSMFSTVIANQQTEQERQGIKEKPEGGF